MGTTAEMYTGNENYTSSANRQNFQLLFHRLPCYKMEQLGIVKGNSSSIFFSVLQNFSLFSRQQPCPLA